MPDRQDRRIVEHRPLRAPVELDAAGHVPLVPRADEERIDVGVLFSTDGRIASEGWVLLEDDQGMLAADNIFPILSEDVADAYGQDLIDLLDEVSAALTTEDLIELNKRYDVDREDADDIAEDWLAENGFGD